jgi:diaminohydroxyphosphoribosylaminopyrimidine deaminase/5-amino-6-(5-phosphoribosylamino)uracil reductase
MDEQYMRQALEIAQYAIGRTSPNPMVGAIIVNQGRIVGQGWHRQAGTPHAEIHALAQAGNLAEGATVYVTLEPCSHCGRTGPCTEALIQAKVRKVVVAMNDPNPLVAGKGVAKLRAAGIEVIEDVLAAEAAKVNEVFIKWISCQLPFVTLKTAMTLDGKIATYSGNSKWITGAGARRRVHELRDVYDAIMVGIGTILADDPELTTRLNHWGKSPIRIVIDSTCRTPLTAKVVADKLVRTIVAVTSRAPAERVHALQEAGVEVIITSEQDGKVNLYELMKVIATKGITSVLLEGGTNLNASMMNSQLVDKVHWFIAPKIVGGAGALGPIGGQGVNQLENAYLLEDLTNEIIDGDVLITGYLRNREGRDVYRTCGRIGES